MRTIDFGQVSGGQRIMLLSFEVFLFIEDDFAFQICQSVPFSDTDIYLQSIFFYLKESNTNRLRRKI